ncbi:PLP-dependent aminotransferase family protein [uncultured Acetobacterium sp.]|uniref:aminotransferase-like domain-containing protein n=1 Tax=uncultured Acetobacterium sp. TaxID=217139 RepID=UPI0025F42037|nr:PLP-dependent aminotransferase family protein [uncultured Acetobacterium sp.]
MRQYEKVLETIRTAVLNGGIKSGDKLPSIRGLSEQLHLSNASVIKAYQVLEASHSVYVIPKSGYYWMEQPPEIANEMAYIDFTKMHPDKNLIPFREFQHCLDQSIAHYKRELFCYGPTSGLPSLLIALQNHLAKRQIFCDAHSIVITSGSQQALALLATTDFENGRNEILVEQPSYGVFQSLHALNGIPMTGISRTENGLDFKMLESAMKTGRFKCFYTIPRCHNPLGTSLTEKEKQRLVALAAKYQVYIIEDDYLADLSYGSKSMPLYYYDTHQMVIYVKSFSKAFLPGIRLGLAVMPPKRLSAFTKQKKVL